MCKLCAIAARYPPARVRQESLVFNLSQFAVAVEAQSSTEKPATFTHSNHPTERPDRLYKVRETNV